MDRSSLLAWEFADATGLFTAHCEAEDFQNLVIAQKVMVDGLE
jgi:hypothetical protein